MQIKIIYNLENKTSFAMNKILKPFVKWAGGKEKELPIILKNIPKNINNYFEPFVGGGAVFFSLSNLEIAGKRFINDKSEELVALYRNIAMQDADFFSYLYEIEHNWTLLGSVTQKHKIELLDIYKKFKSGETSIVGLKDLLDAFVIKNKEDFNGMLDVTFNTLIEKYLKNIVSSCSRKLCRVKQLEEKHGDFGSENVIQNIETAFKSAFYTHFRYLYNKRRSKELSPFLSQSKCSAIFYFIREFCYASMFRYNSNGEFNVPYGGMAYNDKNFIAKIKSINSPQYAEYLSNCIIGNEDFDAFMKKYDASKDDFIFLDPPYDTEFSDYAQNSFDKRDQRRLADFCSKSKARIMIVIKETPFIRELYETIGFKIQIFEKTYMVNFQNRNDRKVNHLLITNY